MQSREAVIICDGGDGECDEWDLDFYEQNASRVGGTRITSTERAPGWTSSDAGDFCPAHKPEDGVS